MLKMVVFPELGFPASATVILRAMTSRTSFHLIMCFGKARMFRRAELPAEKNYATMIL